MCRAGAPGVHTALAAALAAPVERVVPTSLRAEFNGPYQADAVDS